MINKYQITCSAEFESLAAFRNLIDRACQEYEDVDDQDRYDLKLAVDEACSNVITHGYAGMNPGSIIFTIYIENDQALMTITDFGHSFEPCEAPMPDIEAGLENKGMSGFGLFFIYQTMDYVDYEASTTGNRLILMKKLKKASEGISS